MKSGITLLHGFIDYTMSLLLLFTPYLLHLEKGMPRHIFTIVGAVALLCNLLTNYKFGIIKIIPLQQNLMLDIFSGFILTLSPWLFGFSDKIYVPHIILGTLQLYSCLFLEFIVPVKR